MPQVNHEGSIVNTTPSDPRFDDLFGQSYSVVGLVQSVSITARTNSEAVAGIGYRGAPAISDRAGTFETTIEGIMTHPSGIGRTLYDYLTPINTIRVEGTDADENKGLRADMTVPYLTALNFNFRVNENATVSSSWICEDISWTDNITKRTPIIGNGTQFIPTFFDQIVMYWEDPVGTKVIASGIQSASFSATLDRTEVLHLGQRTAIDRAVTFPFAVTVSVETLGEDSDKITDLNNSYRWGSWRGGDGITCAVIRGTFASGILGAQPTCIASGLRPSEGSWTVAVGNPTSNTTTSFTGWDIRF